MGGEDCGAGWKCCWKKSCSPKARTLAYSYIGPENHLADLPRWHDRQAKKDLERAARSRRGAREKARRHAWVSVNKAVVTQASAAIPVVRSI